MRILHTIATLSARYGGPSKACFEMARALARRGHEVSVFTTNQGHPGPLDVPLHEPIERDGVTVRHFPVSPPRFWGTSPPMARALRDAIPRADVVHLHSLYLFHCRAAGRACSRSGVPYVVQPHGALDPYLFRRHRLRKRLMEVWFQDAVTRGAGAIQFTTEEEMRLARPYIFGTRGVVAPIGLGLDEYDTAALRGRFRAAHPRVGDRPVVLFLGRLNFKKGIDILVRAFSEAIRAVPEAHLVIAGPDGGLRARTEAWIGSHGLRERSTLLDMVTGPEKLALLADADLFVLPSWSENFGIAVIEAMACSLPVVVSDRVNLWREVAGAGAGWVVPPEPGATRDAIVEALFDPVRAREKGARGRALVAERFTWTRIAPLMEEVYASVAGPPPS